MVRDLKRAEVSRKNGKRGGNPDLKKAEKKDAKIVDNPEIDFAVSDGNKIDIQSRDNQTLVYPEARGQNLDKKDKDKSLSKKTGTRLPQDWGLSRSLGEWAMSEGLTRDEVLREQEKFRNYWHALTGAKATKIDWDKTFKNWIYNHLERKPNHVRSFSKSEQADAAIQRGLDRLEQLDQSEGGMAEATFALAPPVV